MSGTKNRNPRHYLFYLNIVLLLILTSEIGFYFFIFPKVAVNKIELESDLPLSDADVRELLGFYKVKNYYSIDVAELAERAKGFALVDEIKVSKEFPDRLKVQLKSRKPILVILQKIAVEDDWHSIPILVDAEGVMFQVGLGHYDDVPVLSGMTFGQGNPLNSRLPKALHPLVADLGTLKRERPELYALISEVRATMQIANIETDIYLEDAPSYIKTNGKIDAHIIETVLISLEVLRRSNEKIRFLDMRTTGIVYRPDARDAPKASAGGTL